MNTFLNIIRQFVIVSMFFSCFLVAQEKEFQAGKDAFDRGDFITAIGKFREVTQKDKKNLQGYLWLAKALVKADSLDAVTGALVLAKDLDPNNAMIYVLQGDVYFRQNIVAAAINEYQKATELEPKNLEAWVKLAGAQRKNRSYNDAAKSYHTVLTLDSMNTTALRELGTVLFRAKHYGEALPYIEKLNRLFPDSLDYQIKYVKCLSAVHRWQDLLPVAETLTKKDASLTETQAILDSAYAILKMNRKIIDSYKDRNLESLKIDDLIRYVRALQSEQIYDTAETVYKVLFKKDSTRCDVRYYFGTNEMKLKKWSEAVKQFEKKIECDTSAGFQFASHLNAAMSQMQLKKFKEGVAHTKKAIEYRSDNVQAWVILAECYGQIDQISEEITTYKKVIDLANGVNNGEEGKYDAQLQEAYRMIGVRLLIDATKDKDPKTNKVKYEEAAKYLKNAVQLNPKDCQALLWLAQSYQNSNDKENAIKYYHKLLENCPKSKEAEDGKKGLKTLGVE